MNADTPLKRASAINLGSPWRGLNLANNAAIPQGERQAVMYFYSGILWTPLVPPIPPAVASRSGSDDPGKPRRKNKYDLRVPNYQSPANYPREPVAVPVIAEPELEPIILETSGKPIAVIVPKAIRRALIGKHRSIMEDPAVQQRLAEVQARLRQESEDEEALLMLGGFD